VNQMHFETTEHECELFLAAEGVGFLMLSADGEMLRKWQGLTIGEYSICAGVRWEFGHAGQTRPLSRRHWKLTRRDTHSITRQWRADCGCELQERWDWSSPSEGLLITLSIDDKAPPCQPNTTFCLRAIPLWTLAHAGDSTCGLNATRLIHNPRQAQTLHVSLQEPEAQLDVSCSAQLYPGQLPEPGEWQPLPSAGREWLPTPKDAQRGEQSAREILTSHAFQLETSTKGTARILFSQVKLPEKKLHPKTIGKRISPTSDFVSVHEKLSTAFCNSAESLNQLIQTRSDGTTGLQAGLPWFTQFWTRDMCHSFRAAFLWSGRTVTGEELITDLWRSSRAGVIPNYTTTQTTTNNSVDALPLLLLSTADLIDHCGWSHLLEKVRPLILEKVLEASSIFLKGQLIQHGPADTWMDAQKKSPTGENIPCSPRSDRAFEIQAFWMAALRRWSLNFEKLNDQKTSQTLFRATQVGLKTIRNSYLCSDGARWADTLRPDGSADYSIRPNVLLGFSALQRSGCLEELLSRDELKRSIDVMLESDLIVPYGVRTLSPETSVQHPIPINDIFEDESPYIHESKIHFHPYHEFGTRNRLEHPDWAYHNGTIWPWLSGAASEMLLLTGHQDLAKRLYETLVHHATDGSQGGALPELLDGLSSHSPWSWPKGAPHQAWSEAAFLHMILECWVGLRLTSFGEKLIVDTTFWSNFPEFKLELSIHSGRVSLQKQKNSAQLSFWPSKPGATLNVCEKYRSNGSARESLQSLVNNDPLTLKLWNS
jgi:glycogen debranching enzyme